MQATADSSAMTPQRRRHTDYSAEGELVEPQIPPSPTWQIIGQGAIGLLILLLTGFSGWTMTETLKNRDSINVMRVQFDMMNEKLDDMRELLKEQTALMRSQP